MSSPLSLCLYPMSFGFQSPYPWSLLQYFSTFSIPLFTIVLMMLRHLSPPLKKKIQPEALQLKMWFQAKRCLCWVQYTNWASCVCKQKETAEAREIGVNTLKLTRNVPSEQLYYWNRCSCKCCKYWIAWFNVSPSEGMLEALMRLMCPHLHTAIFS